MAKGHVKKSIHIFSCLVLVLLSFVVNPKISRAATPTTQLFITEVQVSDGEFIELYNPYDQPVNLEGWTVKYRGSSAVETILKAFNSSDILQPKSFILLTHNFIAPAGIQNYTFNASLANTAGYVVLYDASGANSDLVGWGSGASAKQGTAAPAPASGTSIQRCFVVSALALTTPPDNSLEFMTYSQTTPGSAVACVLPEPVDVCPNIDGNQEVIPDGYSQDDTGKCVIPKTCHLEISEISAQPTYNSSEFVELYNNGQTPASVSLCKLRINSSTDKGLPDVLLNPGEWLAIPFSNGTIRNSAGQITIVNSNNEQSDYTYPETTANQTVNFEPGFQTGIITDQPTPGTHNQLVLLSDEELDEVTGVTALAPCPVGKYRNPDTHRCRNIEAAAMVTACEVGQERNPETNRCRKIGTTSLAPCKEGQERNLDTNRCRKIENGSTLAPCLPGQERNPETNRCRKVTTAANPALAAASNTAAINPMKFGFKIIGLIAAAVIGYGIYEYRTDIKNAYQKVRGSHFKGRPPG